MEEFRIRGGRALHGSLRVGSAKNAVLPVLAACVMCPEPIVLNDVPYILDVENMLEILRRLGVRCVRDGRRVEIDARDADCFQMPEHLSKQLRSSIFMMGSILTRFDRATVTYPGGCEIGLRPIDLHLKGLEALGARISEDHGLIHCDGSAMRGGDVHLDFPSVGATENVMMAAVTRRGVTRIFNAAREPEIVDLERFINAMGGHVTGAGSGTVTIEGVARLHGCEFTPMPDRIVAGTLLCASAATRGAITLTNVHPGDMTDVLGKLRASGSELELSENSVRITTPAVRGFRAYTQPYPGFPTDMQAQMMALACVAQGTSMIVENVFESRFAHAAQLSRMGADIWVHDRTAVIRGGRLDSARVSARDLRGGAALVIAGLAASGETVVDNIGVIDRGYESFENMLGELGADMARCVVRDRTA